MLTRVLDWGSPHYYAIWIAIRSSKPCPWINRSGKDYHLERI